ncbi:ABC transporter permease [Pseudaminobacter arsenicus]|uniref:ABC transporter permease n=1 Tax=Borborobacter arsenicus TaxID=1851146 RepID=A0A432VBB0_9HYPH|nr:ABC transporter substrate-binding protein [Pseudaminobacter arsenicus]RUM99406.1 ABC transporter permease [Pseudaminobacter arsenicus]
MRVRNALLAAVVMTAGFSSSLTTPVFAQEQEQFFPLLVFRTGPYAPSGVPWANGFVDYYKLVNARGGINGVKAVWEECETSYATDRGVECYERLKGKNGGATLFQTMSTGITFALTEKAPGDKIPILTPGYGRSDSADGGVFEWNFPLTGTHAASADTQLQYVASLVGGLDKLQGKKITLLYHDSPYGKEAIPILQKRAEMHGFDLSMIPVTHPGVEQKSAWLQIRQNRPDFVLLWGWGVMNSTALKEAQATGFPRDKIVGVWPSGSESDVKGISGAEGYSAVLLQPGSGPDSQVVKDILELVHAKGEGTGPKEEVGEAVYMRGVVNAMLSVEGVRAAQEKFGVGKTVTGEQARWGYEHLDLTQEKLDALGFHDVMREVKTSCADHMGSSWARAYVWDGTRWKLASDTWFQADMSILDPLVKTSADAYAAEKKLERRRADDCQS